MLEQIRSYSKGWLAWIIVIFIIFVFVALGLEGLLGTLGGGGTRKMNLYGEEVTAQQLQAFKELFGADFAPIAAQIGYLKWQGFYVTETQIDQAIIANPQFATNGKYDPHKFSGMLHGNENYIRSYRDYLAYQLYSQQQYNVFSFANFFPTWLVDDLYQVLNQTRDFTVLEIPYAKYLPGITITDQEAADYYKNNSYKFIASEKVKIQYLNLKAADLTVNNPTEKQLQTYYHSNPDKFSPAEQSFAAIKPQVQLQLKQQMLEEKFAELKSQLEDKLYNNEALEKIAKDLNLTVKESGYFTRQGGSSDVTSNSSVIIAAFSNAVISDKQTSNIIELDPTNIVVLSAIDHIPPEQQPFAAVKEQLIADLKIERAQAIAKQKAEQALQELNNNGQIKDLASKNGWKIISRNGALVSQMSNGDQEVSAAFFKEIFNMPRSKNNLRVIKQIRDQKGNYALLELNKVTVPDINKADKKTLAPIITQLETNAMTQNILMVINSIEKTLKG